jgi:hypothetical protein
MHFTSCTGFFIRIRKNRSSFTLAHRIANSLSHSLKFNLSWFIFNIEVRPLEKSLPRGCRAGTRQLFSLSLPTDKEADSWEISLGSRNLSRYFVGIDFKSPCNSSRTNILSVPLQQSNKEFSDKLSSRTPFFNVSCYTHTSPQVRPHFHTVFHSVRCSICMI